MDLDSWKKSWCFSGCHVHQPSPSWQHATGRQGRDWFVRVHRMRPVVHACAGSLRPDGLTQRVVLDGPPDHLQLARLRPCCCGYDNHYAGGMGALAQRPVPFIGTSDRRMVFPFETPVLKRSAFLSLILASWNAPSAQTWNIPEQGKGRQAPHGASLEWGILGVFRLLEVLTSIPPTTQFLYWNWGGDPFTLVMFLFLTGWKPIASMYGIFTYIRLLFYGKSKEIYHTWMVWANYSPSKRPGLRVISRKISGYRNLFTRMTHGSSPEAVESMKLKAKPSKPIKNIGSMEKW